MYKTKKRGWLPWVVGVSLLLAVVLLIVQMRDVLSPFVVAAVLAYILNPLVEKLCRHGVRRGAAAMLVMVFTLLLLVLLLLIVVPMLVQQFGSLLGKMPELANFVQNKALPLANRLLGTHWALDEQSLSNWLSSHLGSVQTGLSKALPALLEQGGSLVSSLGNLAVLPFLLYYFLLDWSRWTEGIKTMIPRRYLAAYTRIGGNMDTVLGEFLRGQLTVMLIMGLLFGCLHRPAVGHNGGAVAVWHLAGADYGVGGVCRGAVSGKFLHHAEDCGRPHRAFAVLGDFRLDGFRQPAGFCGHAAGAAFGRGNAGVAAGGRGGIYG